MPDLNIICKVCYDKGVHFAVSKDAFGEVLIEKHFVDKHPEVYAKYLKDQEERNAQEKSV